MSKRKAVGQLEVTRRRITAPDASGIISALSRIGYSLEEAVADLLDNSIDAGATHVLVRFFRGDNALVSMAIVDNGSGMSDTTIDDAMTFGRRHKGADDLGKYGMGLKSAAFSQCKSLTVASRMKKRAVARRWTFESIGEGWKLDVIDANGAASILDLDWGVDGLHKSGTVVYLERFQQFAASEGRADQEYEAIVKKMRVHLGLHFHRFIADGRLTVTFDLTDLETGQSSPPATIEALDPFPESTGREGYPVTFHARIPGTGPLDIDAEIWPAKSKDPGYKLGGRVAQRQGLYFYRNDRLIQAGGWNGYRDDAEPHSSLARAAVELPPDYDDAFSVNVQKSGVDAPTGFIGALREAKAGSTRFQDYLNAAEATYRDAGPSGGRTTRAVPGNGLNKSLRKALSKILVPDGDAIPVSFTWAALDDGLFFDVDLKSRTIFLNQRNRHALLGGRRGSSGDLPVIKLLLLESIGPDILKQRRTKKLAGRIDLLNALLSRACLDE